MTTSLFFSVITLWIILCCVVTAKKLPRRKVKKCKNHNTIQIAFNPSAHVKQSQMCPGPVLITWETRLYSSNSQQHLQILNSGRVDGLGQENSPYAKVSIESVSFGIVLIRGVESNLYLCVDKKGKLKGLKKRGKRMRLKRCRFKEHEHAGYYMYQSDMYRKWFLTINKRGKVLKGPRSQFKLKAKLFLQRDFEKESNGENFYSQRKRLNSSRKMKRIQRILLKKARKHH